MKSKLLVALLVVLMAVAGCSSKPASPQDQLKVIDTMLAKDYNMPNSQRQQIVDWTNEGKELLKQGKTAEATQMFDKAIKELGLAADADRFNKSE